MYYLSFDWWVYFTLGFLAGFFFIALSILAYAWYLKRDAFFMGLQMMNKHVEDSKGEKKDETK